MPQAYCSRINKVWYCVVTDENGKAETIQFSLKSKEDALRLASKTTLHMQMQQKNQMSPQIKKVLQSLADLFEGRDPKTPIEISTEGLPSFTVKILRAAANIPRGFISTYKLLASAGGFPTAARAAGNVMARNPFPLLIPCHRVVKSDLNIGNYAGGVEVKKMILEKEGVHVNERGKGKYRVSEKYLYKFME